MTEVLENIKKNLPEIPIDYVTNDYDGYFQMMKDAIPLLTPEWTDTSDTDQGIVILQLLSYGLHVLGYYQERTMQENILELARTKRGILTACKFLGYDPKRQTASTVTLTIKKDNDYDGRECVVPKGAKFSTEVKLGNPIIFETVEDLVIGANETYGKVDAIQGVTIKSEVIGVGNGNSNQSFTIPNADVLVDSLEVFNSDNGMIRHWTRKDNFLDSRPNDRHYTISLDEEDRTVIHFGDGIFGRKFPEGQNVYVTYRIGGGKEGNLAPNLITYIYETDMDLNFIEEVYNEDFAQGGSDYEDLERARIRAPKQYRSRGQAITTQDFEDIAELTEGIAKARCVETFNTATVYLYLLADNYEAPTEALCNKVKDTIDANRVGSVDLQVLPCTITPFDIKVKIYVHDKFDHVKVQEAVKAQIQKDFHVSNFSFGSEFFSSRVIESAFGTAGVKNVVIDYEVTKDLTSGENEILKLRNVEVEIGGL